VVDVEMWKSESKCCFGCVYLIHTNPSTARSKRPGYAPRVLALTAVAVLDYISGKPGVPVLVT
jgi:hypothetical protein